MVFICYSNPTQKLRCVKLENKPISFDCIKRKLIVSNPPPPLGGGGKSKVFEQRGARKQFLLHNMQNSLSEYMLNADPLYFTDLSNFIVFALYVACIIMAIHLVIMPPVLVCLDLLLFTILAVLLRMSDPLV